MTTYNLKNMDDVFNFLIDYTYFTEDELLLIINILGRNVESLNKAIYVRTGYRDIDQLYICDILNGDGDYIDVKFI